MSDDTHVTDVGGLVHKGPNLVCIAGFVVSVTHDARWAGVVYSPTVKLLRGGRHSSATAAHTKNCAREGTYTMVGDFYRDNDTEKSWIAGLSSGETLWVEVREG